MTKSNYQLVLPGIVKESEETSENHLILKKQQNKSAITRDSIEEHAPIENVVKESTNKNPIEIKMLSTVKDSDQKTQNMKNEVQINVKKPEFNKESEENKLLKKQHNKVISLLLPLENDHSITENKNQSKDQIGKSNSQFKISSLDGDHPKVS